MASREPVLYVIVCGSPAATGVYDLVSAASDDGWHPCVITTPMGARFVDLERLATLTAHPVRSDYKRPEDPDVLPPADAFVVAPATFNTINKLAHGISDTLAVGLLCEGLGNARPVIVAPWLNTALARSPAYRRGIELLRADGVRLVLTDRTQPEPPTQEDEDTFPWNAVRNEIRKAKTECP